MAALDSVTQNYYPAEIDILSRMEPIMMERVEVNQTKAHSAGSKDIETKLVALVVAAAAAAVPEPAFESILQMK